jgi:YggT family protein
MHILAAVYFYFLSPVLTLLFFLVFAWVIVGWLVAFNIINMRNPNARAIVGLLSSIVEPLCKPFRKLIPPINGVLDLSPFFLLLTIVFLRDWALPELIRMIIGVPRVGL